MNLLSSRRPVQEIDGSIELELEFMSYNIQELKSMVYIAARYTYHQWIGFLADLFFYLCGVHCITFNHQHSEFKTLPSKIYYWP